MALHTHTCEIHDHGKNIFKFRQIHVKRKREIVKKCKDNISNSDRFYHF